MVDGVLVALGLGAIPRIVAVNKTDRARPPIAVPAEAVRVSARTGAGLPELLARLDAAVGEVLLPVRLRLPHTAGAVLAELYEHARVRRARHTARGIAVDVELPEYLRRRLQPYLVRIR